MCTKKLVIFFSPKIAKYINKPTTYNLPVDRYITKIAGTLYPGGHLIIKNRYFNSSVTVMCKKE